MGAIFKSIRYKVPAGTLSGLLVLLFSMQSASAITPIPTPKPKPGSYGLEAVKTQAPPTRGATITTPGNGASFSTSPIDVNGTCPTGLLVQIYNNKVLVGSVMCKNGSFSIKVSLFSGKNELSAMVYDDIGQAGPKSNIVTVTYHDPRLEAFGQLVTLTSSYGRRAAAATMNLEWPLQLSGGTGPYAFSIDWGDGTPPELKSQALSGVVMINHVYKNAGIYTVNVKVTDKNGVSAFLQLIAVSNGEVDKSAATESDDKKVAQQAPAQILWIPTILALVLLIPSYWLGRRSQLVSIRNKMLKERDSYEAEATENKSS